MIDDEDVDLSADAIRLERATRGTRSLITRIEVRSPRIQQETVRTAA
jgi:hypothetical protein